jgi:hypothetical protein
VPVSRDQNDPERGACSQRAYPVSFEVRSANPWARFSTALTEPNTALADQITIESLASALNSLAEDQLR